MRSSSLYPLLADVERLPTLRAYAPLCREFIHYLEVSAAKTYEVEVVGRATGIRETLIIPSYNRYHPVYRDMVYAKLCRVRDADLPGPLHMLTLTVSGRKYTAFQAWEILKQGWNKISKLLRKYVPGLQYVWVYEAHRGRGGRPGRNYGYPHMHVITWGEFPADLPDRLAAQWAKYGYGSKTRGLTVKEITLDDTKKAHYYIMKYITKDKGTAIIEDAAELVFHTLAWRSSHRLWGASAGLQEVMARDDQPKYRLADPGARPRGSTAAFVLALGGVDCAGSVARITPTGPADLVSSRKQKFLKG